jgi:osmoprotectant transport system permease protein
MIRADNDGLPGLDRVPVWLNDPANWSGPDGVLVHLRQHVVYTAVAVLIALAIALPLGLLIGHTGRGVFLVAGLTNGLRAIPTLGLLTFLVVWASPKIHLAGAIPGIVPRGALPYVVPVEIALVVLAIPPILTNAYAGVQNVDPAARDAASGMGMTGAQVLRRVEFPIALPLIMAGLRSSTLQVIATATVAAYVPFLGGLGQFIINGAQVINDPHAGYPAMVSAGLIVAALAVIADLLLLLVQRLVVSPGVSGRFSRKQARPDVPTAAVAEVELAKV